MKFGIAIIILVFYSSTSYSQTNRKIAITIDDLIGVTLSKSDSTLHEINSGILNALVKNGSPAIGFVNEAKILNRDGSYSKEKLGILENWPALGFDLGNHTYSHLDYNLVDTSLYFEEIILGARFTKPLLENYQRQLKYFRHPYLHRGDTKEKVFALEQFLISNNYLEAPVTIDNAEYIFARAYEIALTDGNIDLASTIGRSYLAYMTETVKYFEEQSLKLFDRNVNHSLLIHANLLNAHYLDKLIQKLMQEGYTFVTLDEVLTDEAYTTDDKFITRSGISWIHRWAITAGVNTDFFTGQPHCPNYVQKIARIFE